MDSIVIWRKLKYYIALLILSIIIAVILNKDFKLVKKEMLVPADCVCAKFEYIHEIDNGYKIITSEIMLLVDTINSLNLVEIKDPFDEKWIYKITFNCHEVNTGTPEIPVLIGEKSMKINKKHYTTKSKEDFDNILYLISSKYEYFDYELKKDY